MVLTRPQLAAAIAYWGQHGTGGEPGITLPREASKLIDVLGEMDYLKQVTASLEDGSERALLAAKALQGAP